MSILLKYLKIVEKLDIEFSYTKNWREILRPDKYDSKLNRERRKLIDFDKGVQKQWT